MICVVICLESVLISLQGIRFIGTKVLKWKKKKLESHFANCYKVEIPERSLGEVSLVFM